MHCYICDAHLSDDEIQFEPDFNRYAPCRTCIAASGTKLSVATDDEDIPDILKGGSITDVEGDPNEQG